MSMLSAQRDELLKAALGQRAIGRMELFTMIRDAADTIWQLRNDCVDLRNEAECICDENNKLKAENEKLRELVLILLTCASDVDDCDKCPINGGAGVWDFKDFCDGLLDRVHELRIKVE